MPGWERGNSGLWVLDLSIHGRKVKLQLAQMLRFELAALEFNQHITAQLEVIEQQVDKKLVTAEVQQHLPSDECKAGTQFQQAGFDLHDQDGA